MEREVERDQAPDSVDRVDKPHAKGPESPVSMQGYDSHPALIIHSRHSKGHPASGYGLHPTSSVDYRRGQV